MESVGFAAAGGAAVVRSSANPRSAPVILSPNDWQEFAAGVRDGAFDEFRPASYALLL